MKVVLDSSVLIAASISRAGVCAELLEDVLTHHELVISDFIAEELSRKLRDGFNFPESEARQLRRFLLLDNAVGSWLESKVDNEASVIEIKRSIEPI